VLICGHAPALATVLTRPVLRHKCRCVRNPCFATPADLRKLIENHRGRHIAIDGVLTARARDPKDTLTTCAIVCQCIPTITCILARTLGALKRLRCLRRHWPRWAIFAGAGTDLRELVAHDRRGDVAIDAVFAARRTSDPQDAVTTSVVAGEASPTCATVVARPAFWELLRRRFMRPKCWMRHLSCTAAADLRELVAHHRCTDLRAHGMVPARACDPRDASTTGVVASEPCPTLARVLARAAGREGWIRDRSRGRQIGAGTAADVRELVLNGLCSFAPIYGVFAAVCKDPVDAIATCEITSELAPTIATLIARPLRDRELCREDPRCASAACHLQESVIAGAAVSGSAGGDGGAGDGGEVGGDGDGELRHEKGERWKAIRTATWDGRRCAA